jgi:uncharacterized membrane protein YqgA involved in biofilm formation
VTGAILNAAGILVGGVIGLARTRVPGPATQSYFKTALGAFTVFYGLQLTWRSLSLDGPVHLILKQVAIVLLAVTFGKLTGRLSHLQKASNQLGQYARRLIEETRPEDPRRFSNGLNVCAILFCAAPLGLLGAVQDGLSGYFQPLAVKAVMDGLAMLGFVSLFGGGAMLSALPVFVFQGAITLACTLYLEPFLRTHGLLESVNAAGGLIVCMVGLVIFELKRIELADYLPSLIVAPVIAWLWR